MGCLFLFFFFFNDTATTEIYTLSLHDALPIFSKPVSARAGSAGAAASRSAKLQASSIAMAPPCAALGAIDRKSTRLNSSHANISYAVFCLKKKKNKCIILSSRVYMVYHHTTHS